MKKIILLFAVILFLTACQNDSKKLNESKTYNLANSDTLSYVYDSLKVYSKNIIKNNTYADTTTAVIKYPVFEDDILNNFVRNNVTDYIAKDEKNTTYEYIVKSFINGFDQFYNENKDRNQSWFLDINLKVIQQLKDYIAIQYVNADYSGGAHPNTYFTYINYNTHKKQNITIDSLFDAESKIKLKEKAEVIFRKNEKLTPTASLTDEYFFENGQFALAQNFYLTDKGLMFLYNPYEIKAYAFGTTELLIPYTEIKSLLKPHTVLSTKN